MRKPEAACAASTTIRRPSPAYPPVSSSRTRLALKFCTSLAAGPLLPRVELHQRGVIESPPSRVGGFFVWLPRSGETHPQGVSTATPAGGTRDECSPETGPRWHPKSMSIRPATRRHRSISGVMTAATCRACETSASGEGSRIPCAMGSSPKAETTHPAAKICAGSGRASPEIWLDLGLKFHQSPQAHRLSHGRRQFDSQRPPTTVRHSRAPTAGELTSSYQPSGCLLPRLRRINKPIPYNWYCSFHAGCLWQLIQQLR
jgi:hypothetical protein